jgi:hypothetical protein
MKKTFVFGLFMFLSVLAFSQSNTSFEYNVFEENGSREIIITKYTNQVLKRVIIPEEINGIPVTVIGDNAFLNAKLTDVVLPKTLKKIGDKAFFGNNILTIIIPDNVRSIGIDNFIFYRERYSSRGMPNVTAHDAPQGSTQIIIGNDVTIGNGFASNNFVSYYNDNGKKAGTYIQKSGFYWERFIDDNEIFRFLIKNSQMNSLSIISYEGTNFDVIIPSRISNIPVTSIERYAFANKPITSINIGIGIKDIGDYAFLNTILTTIIIGKDVNLSDKAFSTAFYRYYYNNDRKAGEYIFNNGEWICDFQ